MWVWGDEGIDKGAYQIDNFCLNKFFILLVGNPCDKQLNNLAH